MHEEKRIKGRKWPVPGGKKKTKKASDRNYGIDFLLK